MRVNVVYDNRRHRLLSLARVKLKQGGAELPETAGSAHGLRTFDVTGGVGTTVVLDFSIPTPGDPSAELMFFTQEMQVATGAQGRLTLTPAAKGRFAGDFHPRLLPKPAMVASGTGSVVTIHVDLTFIDVTDRCLGLGVLREYNALTPQVNPAGGPAPAPHYGCELRLLEYTKGLPATWAVLIPKTMIDQDTNRNIPVVLFYRPTGAVYTNSDNVKLGEFNRYLGDPPAAEPFYASGNQQNWNAHPNCGWERQIAECKKAFIFVHPFPHGGGFGDLEGATVPALLSAVVNTLWADSHIGAKVPSGLGRSRTIAAAFSFGGDALFKMLKALGTNADRIRELFLFDANGFTANLALLTRWFNSGGQRLRLIGGSLHTGMLAFAKSLNSPDATVFPKTADYWQKDDLYRSAVFMREFATVGSSNGFSRANGMFEKATTQGDTAIVLEGKTAAGVAFSSEVANCSNREAAACILVTFNHPPPKPSMKPKIPVTTKADLDHNVAILNATVKFVRHQWPVVGGDDKNKRRDRQEEFVGYLQQCLELAKL